MRRMSFVAAIILMFSVTLVGTPGVGSVATDSDDASLAKRPDYDYRLWHEVCFEDGETWPMEKLTDDIYVQGVYTDFNYATLRCGKVHGTNRHPRGWGYRKIFKKHGDEFRRHMRGIGPCHGGKDCIMSEVIHRVLKNDYRPKFNKEKHRWTAVVRLKWKFKGNWKKHKCTVVFGSGNGAIITAYPKGK